MLLLQKLRDLLAKSGLSEDEIRFFVAVLKNPHVRIYELAKIAGVQKDKAYKICAVLEERKLIIFEKDGKWKKPKLQSLSGFIEKLNSSGREYFKTAEKLSELKSFLPLLSAENQEVGFEFFDNDEAAEKYLDMTYLNFEQIFGYGCFDAVIPAISENADRQFIVRRMRKGAEAFPVIANPVGYSLDLLKNDYKELRKSKVIFDENISNYFVTVVPEADTFGIWMRQKSGLVNGMIVKNPMLTNLHKNIFDFLYGRAEDFQRRG